MDLSQGLALLREQIQQADELKRLRPYNQRYKIWRDTTKEILNKVIRNGRYVRMFNDAGLPRQAIMDDVHEQELYLEDLERSIEFLHACVEEQQRFPEMQITDEQKIKDQEKSEIHHLLSCDNCKYEIPGEFEEVSQSFNVCPKCGQLYSRSVFTIENFFRIMQVTPKLQESVRLVKKSELTSAVREAVTSFEDTIRKLSGLSELGGADLMAQAFNFEYDVKTSNWKRKPLIKINKLSTKTERNEQDGVKLLAMGLMRGIRNIYQHTTGDGSLYYCLNIIALVDLLLKQLPGGPGPLSKLANR